jgi:uncharacterized protein (TIGR03067 family)
MFTLVCRIFAAVLLACGSCALTGVVAPPASAQTPEEETKLLQGRWRVVSAEHNGCHIFGQSAFLKGELLDKATVTIDKDRLTFSVEGLDVEQKAAFRLDPKKAPKQIDFRPVSEGKDLKLPLFRRIEKDKPENKDAVGEGIYKLDGDKLTLCWRMDPSTSDKDKASPLRPLQFESIFYRLQFLLVLERIKPEK